MLRAVTHRVHAVPVNIYQRSKGRAAIYRRFKGQEAATNKRAALCFHSTVRLFVYTFRRFAKRVCAKDPIRARRRFTRTRYR
jgi:hypothetical protein